MVGRHTWEGGMRSDRACTVQRHAQGGGGGHVWWVDAGLARRFSCQCLMACKAGQADQEKRLKTISEATIVQPTISVLSKDRCCWTVSGVLQHVGAQGVEQEGTNKIRHITAHRCMGGAAVRRAPQSYPSSKPTCGSFQPTLLSPLHTKKPSFASWALGRTTSHCL